MANLIHPPHRRRHATKISPPCFLVSMTCPLVFAFGFRKRRRTPAMIPAVPRRHGPVTPNGDKRSEPSR